MPVMKGDASGGTWASATGGRGPRTASVSWSARSMLPVERGASIATTSGDGATRAPPGAGSRRVKALEFPEMAWFSMLRVGAPMRRGPPVPGAPMAGTFGLFRLLRWHPWSFVPVPDDPVATEEAEGSMAQRKCSLVRE
jgi:hypothetical protein